MIDVVCAQCGLKIRVPSTVQGRSGVCFGCGAEVRVPEVASQLQSKDLQFSTGDKVAERYVIEELLGRGGMGVVYKAHDTLIDEEVALKFMLPRALNTQRGQQLFIKEAQVARRLRHENIVSVHDVGTTTEGILYLSMEFLKGTTLRTWLRRHRTYKRIVDLRLAIHIVLSVLRALEYAHRTVIHRDVKPENVMLLPGETVKVLDFGLAIAQQEAEAEYLEKAAGGGKPRRVIGTAVYASPEQHRHKPVDYRSDLYTVGLVLHELLTLRTPVDEPVSVVSVRNDVSPSILRVLEKALHTDREQRWQTARAFREALRSAYDESYKQIAITEIRNASGANVSTRDMVYMEGGSFLMGSPELRETAPEFEAYVEPFYMDKYPVTVEQYEKFVEATGHPLPRFWHDQELNGPRQPVTGVTLEDALAYAQWAGKQIPTEREWEFAARGKENRKYPWGTIDPDATRCNFGDYLGMPSVVTMHEEGATPEGIVDLAGNVFEWTIDGFVPYDPKNQGGTLAPYEPRRVVRGGSWHSDPVELVTYARKGVFPETKLTTIGFRCVLPAPDIHTPPEAPE